MTDIQAQSQTIQAPIYRGFLATIGIEIHVQLNTLSKIFCSDATTFNSGDNENVSPLTAGMPGTLPVLNEKVVEYSVKTGMALNCEIRKKSIFARKNYFYPDLPKGYQISQYEEPICEHGYIYIKLDDKVKKISITRAHMEEDAGKSNHSGEFTLLNYNRAGIPLLEIVSGPDMSSPKEAAEYAKTIRQIVRYLNVCDGNLEEGSLRCDCNVSVRKVGQEKLGTKVELKNINSFRFVEKAIEYEIERQIDLVERNEKIVQETRLYDPDKNRTFSMRTKEDAQDYRYFPDPDLLPVIISESYIEAIRKTLPELPTQRMSRLQADHKLPEYDAAVLTAEKEIADYYDEVAKFCGNYKAASNWIMTDVMREINSDPSKLSGFIITPAMLGELIKMIDSQQISGKIAKQVFAEMLLLKKSPSEIVKEKGLTQITDTGALEKVVDEVLAANQNSVEEYKKGKTKLLGFFVGAIMKATKGQANPDLVNELLKRKLS
ncbi:MAG: Asp-tRNA(Asn)/Glu-tRNA(Gln) amidotransferase subunit GatB [Bdellovibrionaceae bacterium]|nr:Asp-tRNA(Asn)/Glu-tRNA(Gln) amidotransferase subunit GatB [Pseudobdellovibrionaceae bacterium]NUM57552.1 Asp-tRNA(Asn)/Glu-tRNA(Gln) amidotransferase subunit GatB [Pseudobdellovibrionaceae bacterium]